MKKTELRRLMERMQETPVGFAELLGVHVATVYRWLAGDSKIPAATAKLLRRIAEDRGVAA